MPPKKGHTTGNKIRVKTCNCFIEVINGNYEGKQKTGEYEESDTYISEKDNLKKTPFLGGK